MANRASLRKVLVIASIMGGLLILGFSSWGQQRTKKQNMVEMGEQFSKLNEKIMAGALTEKLSDKDFEEIVGYCDKLVALTKEYAEMESNQEIASISTSLEAAVNYLKQQATRKDALVAVMSYGQLLSYCAECHYRVRWAAEETEPSPSMGVGR